MIEFSLEILLNSIFIVFYYKFNVFWPISVYKKLHFVISINRFQLTFLFDHSIQLYKKYLLQVNKLFLLKTIGFLLHITNTETQIDWFTFIIVYFCKLKPTINKRNFHAKIPLFITIYYTRYLPVAAKRHSNRLWSPPTLY